MIGFAGAGSTLAQSGLSFNGNQYVTIPGNAAYDLGTGAFTLETTIKFEPTSTANTIIFSSRTNTSDGMLLMTQNSKRDMLIQLQGHVNGGNKTLNVGKDYFDGQCHSVAVVREENGIINFYFDGEFKQSVFFTSERNIQRASETSPVFIGKDGSSSSASSPFQGVVGDVRLWNIARTADEIANFHQIELYGKEAGLIGYWKMNEGAGEILQDFSSLANNAHLGNSEFTADYNPLWGAVLCASNTICLVSNTNSSGPGSFAEAIICANSNPDLSYIVFDIDEPGSEHVIPKTDGLDYQITSPVVIDGGTDPEPIVFVKQTTANVNGLTFKQHEIQSTISNITIKDFSTAIYMHALKLKLSHVNFENNEYGLIIGLGGDVDKVIVDFCLFKDNQWDGIYIRKCNKLVLTNSYLTNNNSGISQYGINPSVGELLIKNNTITGNGFVGVSVISNHTNSKILDNVISGNHSYGFSGAVAEIKDNYFGLFDDNLQTIPNGTGMWIHGSQQTTKIEGNTVVGGTGWGVLLSSYAELKNNFIGVTREGSVLGNQSGGIYCTSNDGAKIGGADLTEANIIGGNSGPGIQQTGDLVDIQFNYIGVGVNSEDLGNQNYGVVISTAIQGQSLLSNNQIANNTLGGVNVYGNKAELTQNIFQNNGGQLAINLNLQAASKGNEGKQAVKLNEYKHDFFTTESFVLSGKAESGDVVELFYNGESATSEQALVYMPTEQPIVADANGEWATTISSGDYFNSKKPNYYVTTLTDIDGNTSQLSAPYLVEINDKSGLLFSGDEYVTIPGIAEYDLRQGSFTLETTIKFSPTSTATSGLIYSSRENTNTGLLLMCNSRTEFLLQIQGVSGGNLILDAGQDYFDGECHTLAVVRDSFDKSIRFYFDGVEKTKIQRTVFKDIKRNLSNSPVFIGKDGSSATQSTPLDAAISEVRLWNIARTAAEISSFHKIELFGTETGLIGYWKMNEGVGEIVKDFSAISNDAYLGDSETTTNHNPAWGDVVCTSDAVCIVTNTNNTGPGSFTDAVTCANEKEEHAYIIFAINENKTLDEPYVITGGNWTLTNPNGITIDGATQSASGVGIGTNQEIVFNGEGFDQGIKVGNSNNIIQFIEMNNYNQFAISFNAYDDNFRLENTRIQNVVFHNINYASISLFKINTSTLAKVDNIVIENCIIETGANGIHVFGVTNISFINTSIIYDNSILPSSNNYGIQILDAKDINVDDVTISGFDNSAIYTSNSEGVVIKNSDLSGFGITDLVNIQIIPVVISKSKMKMGVEVSSFDITSEYNLLTPPLAIPTIISMSWSIDRYRLIGKNAPPMAIVEVFSSNNFPKDVTEYLGEAIVESSGDWYYDLPIDYDFSGIVSFRASSTTESATSRFSTPYILSPVCPVTVTDDSGEGSLRSAIDCVNNNIFENPSVVFNIPGNQQHIIHLSSNLPAITKSTLIDGATQSVYSPGSSILIRGNTSLPVMRTAFTVAASDVTIEGLNFERVNRALNVIKGTGPELTNITFKNNEVIEAKEAVYLEGCNGIEVKDNSFFSGQSASVNIRFCTGEAKIENNTISGGTGDGIILVACNFTATEVVKNNTIDGINGTAIEIDYSTITGAITSNTISNIGEYGISLLNGADVELISLNTISGAALSGIYGIKSNLSQDKGIRENLITNSGQHGIYLKEMNDNSDVFNNTITGSNLIGIYIDICRQFVIDNNKIGNNGKLGLLVRNSQSIFVRGNQIGEIDGIAAPNGSTGITFDHVDQSQIGGQTFGNIIKYNRGNGVSIKSALNYPTLNDGNLTIAYNTISENEISGINTYEVAFLTIHDNEIENNNESVSLYESEQIEIVNNSLFGNAQNGLSVSGSNFIRVKSNEIRNNNGNGVYSFMSHLVLGGVEGEGNIVTSNNGSGIYVDILSSMVASNNFIGTNSEYNTGIGNNEYGVYATDGGALSLEFNTIGGNDQSGVYLSENVDATIYSNWIGTDPSRTINLGNAKHGIESYSSGVFIGTLGQSNVIANNDLSGVFMLSSESYLANNNNISTNLFFNNGEKAINLNLTEEFPANNQKTAPVFLDGGYVTTSGITLIVQAELGDVIEIFTGDGQEGNALQFVQRISITSVPQSIQLKGVSDYYLATATSANNNTSEFSLVYDGSDLPVICPVTDTRDYVIGSLRDAIETCVNAIDRKAIVDFRLQTPGPYNLFLDNVLPYVANNYGVTIDGNSQNDNGLGSGPQEIIIDGAYNAGYILGFVKGTNVSLSNLTFQNSIDEGLYFEDVNNVNIDKVEINNSNQYGIYVVGEFIDGLTISNSSISGGSTAVYIEGYEESPSNLNIFNNSLINYSFNGIRLNDVTNALIKNNYFNTDENGTDLSSGSPFWGIYLASGSSFIEIENNSFGKHKTAIQLAGVGIKVLESISIKSNKIGQINGTDIAYLYNNGIYFRNTKNLLIDNNYFGGQQTNAIFGGYNNESAQIINNTIGSSSIETGIALQNNFTGINLLQNNELNVNSIGLSIAGQYSETPMLVKENTFINSSIGISNQTGNGVNVVENTLSNNIKGIEVDESERFYIDNNSFLNNDTAIFATGVISDVQIKNNQLEENRISIYSKSSGDLTVEENTIFSTLPESKLIELKDAEQVILNDNILYGDAGEYLVVSGGVANTITSNKIGFINELIYSSENTSITLSNTQGANFSGNTIKTGTSLPLLLNNIIGGTYSNNTISSESATLATIQNSQNFNAEYNRLTNTVGNGVDFVNSNGVTFNHNIFSVKNIPVLMQSSNQISLSNNLMTGHTSLLAIDLSLGQTQVSNNGLSAPVISTVSYTESSITLEGSFANNGYIEVFLSTSQAEQPYQRVAISTTSGDNDHWTAQIDQSVLTLVNGSAYILATGTQNSSTSQFSNVVKFCPSCICTVNKNYTGTQEGTLDESIRRANKAECGIIDFAITPTNDSPNEIWLNEPLPVVKNPILIDATTEAISYNPLVTPLVRLRSSNGNIPSGLTLNTNGAEVKGLYISGFIDNLVIQGDNNKISSSTFKYERTSTPYDGLNIKITGNNNEVVDNYINEVPEGSIVSIGNIDSEVIRIEGDGNKIGKSGQGNTIQGNGNAAVFVESGFSGNEILENIITHQYVNEGYKAIKLEGDANNTQLSPKVNFGFEDFGSHVSISGQGSKAGEVIQIFKSVSSGQQAKELVNIGIVEVGADLSWQADIPASYYSLSVNNFFVVTATSVDGTSELSNPFIIGNQPIQCVVKNGNIVGEGSFAAAVGCTNDAGAYFGLPAEIVFELPNTSYWVSSPNTHVFTNQYGTTINPGSITFNLSGNNNTGIVLDNVANWSMENMKLSQFKNSITGSGENVSLKENTFITASQNDIIQLDALGSEYIITNNVFSSGKDILTLTNGDFTIVENEFVYGLGYGLNISNTINSTISSNTFNEFNTKSPIRVIANGGEVTVDGNTFTSGKQLINLSGADFTVSNNKINEYPKGYAISLNEAHGSTIFNNSINSMSNEGVYPGHGIIVSKSHDLEIYGNKFSNSFNNYSIQGTAIYLTGTSFESPIDTEFETFNVVIRNNEFYSGKNAVYSYHSNQVLLESNIGVFSSEDMYVVNKGTQNTLSQNIAIPYRWSSGLGIKLLNGGNNNKTAPEFTRHTTYTGTLTMRGTSEAFDKIELFEGVIDGSISVPYRASKYLSTTNADKDGEWIIEIPISSLSAGATKLYGFTATATNSQGNTSQLSAPFPIDLRSCIVKNINDSGTDSFREAIQKSNQGQCPLISFNIDANSELNIIRIQSPLPTITSNNLIIDGSFEPGYNKEASPEIQITYANSSAQAVGLNVANVTNFSMHGIDLHGFVTGLKLANTPFADVSYNTFSEHTSYGIDVVNTSSQISEYYIDTNSIVTTNFQGDYGIRVTGGSNPQIRGNEIDGHEYAGILLKNLEDGFVSGNKVSNKGADVTFNSDANRAVGIQLNNVSESEVSQNSVLFSNVGISLIALSSENAIQHNGFGGSEISEGYTDIETGQYVPEGYSYNSETKELINPDGVIIKDKTGFIKDTFGKEIERIDGPINIASPIYINGISISNSNNNTVVRNAVSYVDSHGILISNSTGNYAHKNVITETISAGIRINSSNNTKIDSNTVNKAGSGIHLSEANENIINGNKLSDNINNGLLLSNSNLNTVTNNYIGTLNGLSARPNNVGVLLENASSNNSIGGEDRGNVIAYNTNQGVLVDVSAFGNIITYNSIYSNGISEDKTISIFKAIQLNAHPSDPNLHGNKLNAAPVIVGSTKDGDIITVLGTGGEGESIHLYVSTGLPQDAKEFLGTAVVGGGVWTIAFDEKTFDKEHSLYVVATSTDSEDNTSELSNMKAVGSCYVTNVDDNGNDTQPIIGSMRDAVRCVNDQLNNANLFFNIKGQNVKTIELIDHLPALYNPGGVTMNGINLQNRNYPYISTVNISQSKAVPGTTPLLRMAPELGASTIDSISLINTAYGLEVANNGTTISALKVRPGKVGGSTGTVNTVGVDGVRFVSGSANSELKNSNIEGFSTAISVNAVSGPVIIKNNDLLSAENAVQVTNESNQVTIEGNRIDKATLSGIKISGIHDKETIVSANIIGDLRGRGTGVAYAGIWLDNASGVRVTDNTLAPALGLTTPIFTEDIYGKHGVLISTSGTDHEIDNNTFNTTATFPAVYTVPVATPTVYSTFNIHENQFNSTNIELVGVNHQIINNKIVLGSIDIDNGQGVLIASNNIQPKSDNAIDLENTISTRLSGNLINGALNRDALFTVNLQPIRSITINRGLTGESNEGKLAPIIDSAAFIINEATCESVLRVYGVNAESGDIVELFFSNETYPDTRKYLGFTVAEADGSWEFDVPFEYWLLPDEAENYAFTATATKVTTVSGTLIDYATSDLSDVKIIPNEALVKIVVNTDNDGVGSLRDAVNFINCSDFFVEVHFEFENVGPYVIELTEPLPSVYNPSGFTIDGNDLIITTDGVIWTNTDIVIDGANIVSVIPPFTIEDEQFTGFEIDLESQPAELRKLEFRNFYTGIKINNESNILEDLKITNSELLINNPTKQVGEYGIVFENEVASSNELKSSHIQFANQALIIGELNKGIVVTENNIENTDVAISVQPGVTLSLFDQNTVGDARIGFSLQGIGSADPVKDQSNRFYNNVLGSDLQGNLSPIHEYGFFMEEVYQALIDSNKIWSIDEASGAAIYLGVGEYNTISSNLIGFSENQLGDKIEYGIASNGISLGGTLSADQFNRYNIVVANQIHSYSGTGISLNQTSGNTITANSLNQTENTLATTDVGILTIDANGDLIQFNSIVDYKEKGIDLQSSTGVHIKANNVYSSNTNTKGINIHVGSGVQSNSGLVNTGINATTGTLGTAHSYDEFDQLVLSGTGLQAGDKIELFTAPRNVSQGEIYQGSTLVLDDGTWSITLSQAFGSFGVNYFVTTVTRNGETSEYSNAYMVDDWFCQLKNRFLPLTDNFCPGVGVELVADIEGVNYVWTKVKDASGALVNQTLTDLGPSLQVLEAGEYQMVASAGACSKIETVTVIELPAAEDPFFTSATELYLGETLLVVDIQESRVDEIKWDFKEAFELEIPLEDQAKLPGFDDDRYHYLTYTEPGNYQIFKHVVRGECASTLVKPVHVLDGTNPNQESVDLTSIDVQVLEVIPNPSQGLFTVTIDLSERKSFVLFIANVASAVKVFQKEYDAVSFAPTSEDENGAHYSIDFNWPAMAPGAYAISVTDGVTVETVSFMIVK